MGGPIVELQTGRIRGVLEKHEDGFDYYAFRGIPYAEPPIGELRFQDPIPKKSWTGVLDCKNYGETCLQVDTFFKIRSYNEDCLHLNVFSRSIERESERNPVIFLIHGGGFHHSSSDDLIYGPEYMIRKNVVLVTVNYRLGVLGFLNLEDEVAPGNQGLKDLLMGLQWVQRNIRRFGGDPDNVTVLGYSAGGVCAHYLALSPLSKGLFQKVISQGAVLYNAWATFKNPRSRAIEFCASLGRNLTDPAEILRFLRALDAEKLQQALESFIQSLDCLSFGPGIDDKSSRPVMPVDPMLAANGGAHLPYLVGCNSNEAIVTLLGSSRADFFAKCEADFRAMLRYNTADVLQRHGLTAAQVRRCYYKSEAISDRSLDQLMSLSNDLYFFDGVHRFCRVQAERSSASTYLYLFSYDPPDSLSKRILKNPPEGAGHLDELPYFFKMRALEALGLEYAKRGTRQYKMMEQVTEMWTNFARYGRPTVETTDLIPVHWTPIVDGTLLRYLNIDEDITMQSTVNVDQRLLAAKAIRA